MKKKSWLLGKPQRGLYVLKDGGMNMNEHIFTTDKTQKSSCCINTMSATVLSDALANKAKLWHLRMGHLPMYKLNLLFPEINGRIVHDSVVCTICKQDKPKTSILSLFQKPPNLWSFYTLIYGGLLSNPLEWIAPCSSLL